jgi:hypothetical protein
MRCRAWRCLEEGELKKDQGFCAGHKGANYQLESRIGEFKKDALKYVVS